MAQTTTVRRKQSTTQRAIAMAFGLVIVFVSGVLIFNSAKEWLHLYESSQKLKSVQATLSELEAKQTGLESARDKLANPNYVQNFARGVNLMSKSEEQIFVLPKAGD